MAVLTNPRHEAFAQALARSVSASAAYVEAGYKANRCCGWRAKWAENANVVATRCPSLMPSNAFGLDIERRGNE
jgi:hypothetical protein